MTNADPSTTPQKALSPTVLRHVLQECDTPLAEAIGQLIVDAFFFAMRSCEYSTVRGERRTKLLEVQNLRFFKDRHELHHLDPSLHLADSISITVSFQKNDQRDETITMHQTAVPERCPVRAWSAVVARIHSNPSSSDSTTVNTYFVDSKPYVMTSVDTLHALRASMAKLGKAKLGFTPPEIGTHALRSAAAMAMYLAGVAVYTIMLISPWSSDAFLRYIQHQVQEFRPGVLTRMILSKNYFTIPDLPRPTIPVLPAIP